MKNLNSLLTHSPYFAYKIEFARFFNQKWFHQLHFASSTATTRKMRRLKWWRCREKVNNTLRYMIIKIAPCTSDAMCSQQLCVLLDYLFQITRQFRVYRAHNSKSYSKTHCHCNTSLLTDIGGQNKECHKWQARQQSIYIQPELVLGEQYVAQGKIAHKICASIRTHMHTYVGLMNTQLYPSEEYLVNLLYSQWSSTAAEMFALGSFQQT